MHPSDAELEACKKFPLTEVLAHLGFVENRRKSSRCSSFMEHPTSGLKLVISLNTNGHWRFFPINQTGAGGTVVDALALILGLDIPACRRHMRPLLSGTASPPPPQFRDFSRALEPVTSDFAKVQRRFVQSVIPIPDGRHDYLNRVRRIPAKLLALPEFASVLTDNFGNAVFPHYDQDGQTVGAELRNHRFRGQIKGGMKTLWYSRGRQEEKVSLVIAESGIDSCSFAALHFDKRTRYASTGGAMSPLQYDIVRAAIKKLPKDHGGIVIAATDNDTPGSKLANELRNIFDRAGRTDLQFQIHPPETPHKDWNDQMRAAAPSSAPPTLDC